IQLNPLEVTKGNPFEETGDELKGSCHGHVKRIKDQVREERERMYLKMSQKTRFKAVGK
nr:hypothetical protein [Deltaproteobacteria bacterium]